MTAVLFIVSLALIVAAAELFTNGVEWAGFRLKLGSGATGSLLAALGTSLPEAVVPVIALIGGAKEAGQLATGAILGSSFLLLTLGTGCTGVAVWLRRDAPRFDVPARQVRRDLGTFLVAFSAVLLGVVLPHPVRIGMALALLATYAGYVVFTLRGGEPEESMPKPLHMLRWGKGDDPHAAAVVFQLLLAISMLIAGAHFFLDALARTASSFAVPAIIVALIVVPVATELPETLNGVLWVRSGDDGLAFGNVAGSATFQACLLGALGLAFTEWNPRGLSLISAPITLATAAFTLAVMWHGKARGQVLALCIVPWIAYVGVAIATGGNIVL